MARLIAFFLLLTSASGAFAATVSDGFVVFVSAIRRPDTGTVSTFEVRAQNESGEAQQFDLVLQLHGNATLSAVGSEWINCTRETEQRIRCHAGLPLQPGGSYMVPVTISNVVDRRLALVSTIEWTQGGVQYTTEPKLNNVVFPRRIEVTNTGDEGPGSFRAALEYANANCAGIACEITFKDGGRIIFNTPLPPITAPDLTIDGGGKTILDGDALWYGNGIELVGSGVFAIRNIEIIRFPWDGIAIRRQVPDGPFRSVIHGAVVSRNHSRGITLHPPANAVNIESSTINSNFSSGVFIMGGRDVRVDLNTIGRNGASGVFISAESRQVDVYRNEIFDNDHWGVAIGRGAELVEVTDNKIYDSNIAGIDVGIDGPDGFVYDPAADKIGPPLLTARRDPVTGQDVVTGTVPSLTGEWDVTLFFSTEAGGAEGFIGHTMAVNGTFTFILPDQLPLGYYLTASAVHRLNGEEWSTELAPSVQVQYP
jgi:hypothetical protein